MRGDEATRVNEEMVVRSTRKTTERNEKNVAEYMVVNLDGVICTQRSVKKRFQENGAC